jgi:hypothetical protein
MTEDKLDACNKKKLGNAAKHRANWTEDQRESHNKNNVKMPQDTMPKRIKSLCQHDGRRTGGT